MGKAKLTGYFDESGTHGPDAKVMVMAGYVGDDRQWRKFQKRVVKLFGRFRVDIFHTIDVRRTDKDFEGWPVDKKIEFLDAFQHIANETLEHGVAAILSYADYAYYKGLAWPKGVRWDSQYGILFRACLAQAVDSTLLIDRWVSGSEPILRVVLEDGARNSGDAERLYNFFRSKFASAPGALAGLSFAKKGECLPLAIADLFAYSAWGREVGQKPLGAAKKPTKSEASYRGNVYRIGIDRNTLDGLFKQALELSSQVKG